MVRLMRRIRASRGQTTFAFIVLSALAIVLAASTMNLGEVARLKTMTANAADAGALAGASWVASGMNGVTELAEQMWMNWILAQIYLIAGPPWCTYAIWAPIIIYAALILINQLLYQQARDLLHATWDNAHSAAFSTAVSYLEIDDPLALEQVNRDVEAVGESGDFGPIGMPWRVDFRRIGADNTVKSENWAEVEVRFPNGRPSFSLSSWAPWFLVWLFCIITVFWNCCSSLPGMTGLTTTVGIPRPTYGTCVACYIPIPLTLPAKLVTPDHLSNGDGEVIVTVRQGREEGGRVAFSSGAPSFWTMRYPKTFISQATAHYSSASVALWPDDDAYAELRAIR